MLNIADHVFLLLLLISDNLCLTKFDTWDNLQPVINAISMKTFLLRTTSANHHLNDFLEIFDSDEHLCKIIKPFSNLAICHQHSQELVAIRRKMFLTKQPPPPPLPQLGLRPRPHTPLPVSTTITAAFYNVVLKRSP